ncbi:MAG: mechanosensitive ion channel family protein [Chloroflexota bacterium]
MFKGLSLTEIVIPLLVLAGSLLLAWFTHTFLVRLFKKLTQRTKITLDDAAISALERPLIAVFFLAGLYLALLYSPWEPVPKEYLSRGFLVVLSLLGIYIVVGLFNAVIAWYRRRVVEQKKDVGLASRALTLLRVAVMSLAALVALVVVLEGLGITATPVTGWIGQHGWRIVFIVLISIAAIILEGEFVPRLVFQSLAQRSGESPEEVGKRGHTLSRVLVSTMQIAILVIAAFMILSELEIDIAPILAGVGVVGIAIGFGAQSLVKDLIAGIFIILENQYRVGDVVKIADISGLVEDINLRKTVLRDLDGIVHIVPNGEIRVASNFTKEWSRVNLNVSVSYKEDLDRVMSVINRVGKELAEDPQWVGFILTPPRALRGDKLGDSGIEIKILGETKPIRQWDVMGELRKRLKKAFDEEGIEIPWPHTKVYFGNALPGRGDEKASPPPSG